MDLVFSTDGIEPSKRYAAWQGAICDVYVHVDVESDKRSDYQGFIREARFGAVTMTDVLLSEQRISRRERHIAKLDKDCYYAEFVQHGKINILQSGQCLASDAGVGAIFSASEAYDLECIGKVRSLYLEIPRQEFAERFRKDRIPLARTMATGRGLGRIASEFCSMLAAEGAALDAPVRERLGDELMDVLALALEMGDRDDLSADRTVQQVRLRSVKTWIEEHLADPDSVARKNRQKQRHFAAALALSVQAHGYVGVGMDLGSQAAALP